MPGSEILEAISPAVAVEAARAARRKPESLAKIKAAARKLFVERGYHATRPQDIAREAGLGHGTFYLHYPDKRACFLAFVEEARQEVDFSVRLARKPGLSLEETVAATLSAIWDYSDSHPGVLRAALADEGLIDAEGVSATPLSIRWEFEWAKLVQEAVAAGHASDRYDCEIVGQAIVGVLNQVSREGRHSGRTRETAIENLTRFLVNALKK